MRLTLAIFLALVMTAIMIPHGYSISASIGNGKMVLYPVLEEGKGTTIERSILVMNVNNESVIINLEPRGDLINITEILDNNFTLKPFTEKEARFIVNITEFKKYSGSIGVSFTSVNTTNTQGVGLISTIIISPRKANETDPYSTNQPANRTPEQNASQNDTSIGGNESEGQTSSQDRQDNSITLVLVALGGFAITILAILLILKKGRQIGEKASK